jgi:hypothetical protein
LEKIRIPDLAYGRPVRSRTTEKGMKSCQIQSKRLPSQAPLPRLWQAQQPSHMQAAKKNVSAFH